MPRKKGAKVRTAVCLHSLKNDSCFVYILGVGYSSYEDHHKYWDVNAYVAAQKEKDKRILVILRKIYLEMKHLCYRTPETGDETNSLSDLYSILEGSALIPFLESKLQATSFLEICNHSNIYYSVIKIIREMVQIPRLVPLLGPLSDQPRSLQALLSALETQAQHFLDKIDKLLSFA